MGANSRCFVCIVKCKFAVDCFLSRTCQNLSVTFRVTRTFVFSSPFYLFLKLSKTQIGG